jgi:hypothetical protein
MDWEYIRKCPTTFENDVDRAKITDLELGDSDKFTQNNLILLSKCAHLRLLNIFDKKKLVKMDSETKKNLLTFELDILAHWSNLNFPIDINLYGYNSKQIEQIKNSLFNILENFNMANTPIVYYLDHLNYYKMFLVHFNNSEKEKIKDLLAQSIADSVEDIDFFKFKSKIYHLAHHGLGKYFGEKPEPILEFNFIKDRTEPSKAVAIILSTEKLEGDDSEEILPLIWSKLFDPKVDLYQEYKNSNFNQTFLKEYIWNHGGHKYKGSLNISVNNKLNQISTHSTPDYSQILKSKKQTGLIAISNNLDSQQLSSLVEVRKYLMKNDFKFNKESNKIQFKPFLKKAIEQGNLDYMIKVAHNYGDTDHIIEYSINGVLEKAVKIDPQTKIEQTIYIYYSDEVIKNGLSIEYSDDEEIVNDSSHELLNLSEFASWMHTREFNLSNKNRQFIFIDDSCKGDEATIRKIIAINSKYFLPIFANDYTSGLFVTVESDGHVESPILSGLLNLNNFDEIRNKQTNLEKNYKRFLGEESKLQMAYIFPDSEYFANSILKPVSDEFKFSLMPTMFRDEIPYEAMSHTK